MGILKKKIETVSEPYKPEVVETPKVEGCKAPVDGKPCGNALAPGQSEVCQRHVRAG